MLAQPRQIYDDFANLYFVLFVELEPLTSWNYKEAVWD